MRVERFDFDLPSELIAQAPPATRDGARLLRLPDVASAANETVVHDAITNLPDLIEEGTLIVLNDTKVLRARILGTKAGSGGRAEIFLVKKTRDDIEAGRHVQHWHALGRASKALREGTRILKGSLIVTIDGKTDEGLLRVRLSTADGSPLDEARARAGQVPLPPYIKRELRPEDEERYQTVFAKVDGAVAAPTAGLHFTTDLLKKLASRGCEIETCTLHVGLGTFQPVAVEDLDDHPMHSEYYEVSRKLAAAIARARTRNKPVLAVGTTVVRSLESARDPERPGHVRPSAGETRLLIQPGYAFSVVDRLVTNFHLPRSTLLALVCAFGGTDRILAAYREAVREHYRFFSYGDAMLIDRAAHYS